MALFFFNPGRPSLYILLAVVPECARHVPQCTASSPARLFTCRAVPVSHEYHPAIPRRPDSQTRPSVSAEPLQGFCLNDVFAVAYTGFNGGACWALKEFPSPAPAARYRATLLIHVLYGSNLHMAANLRWKVGCSNSCRRYQFFGRLFGTPTVHSATLPLTATNVEQPVTPCARDTKSPQAECGNRKHGPSQPPP